jgi:hypothetical protein
MISDETIIAVAELGAQLKAAQLKAQSRDTSHLTSEEINIVNEPAALLLLQLENALIDEFKRIAPKVVLTEQPASGNLVVLTIPADAPSNYVDVMHDVVTSLYGKGFTILAVTDAVTITRVERAATAVLSDLARTVPEVAAAMRLVTALMQNERHGVVSDDAPAIPATH